MTIYDRMTKKACKINVRVCVDFDEDATPEDEQIIRSWVERNIAENVMDLFPNQVSVDVTSRTWSKVWNCWSDEREV